MKQIAPLFLGILWLVACQSDDSITEIQWEGKMLISDTFTIEEGQQLTIAPGTEVIFEPNGVLIAKGDLIIEGTSDSIIRLSKEVSPDNPTMISVKGEAKTFSLMHAEIQNGLITSFQTDNHIRHVTFKNNQKLKWDDAVARFWLGSVLIENCIVNWNNQGEGFLLHNVQEPIIRNCDFKKVPDAVEYIDCKNGEISSCRFEAMNDDGIDQNHCFKTLIKDNEFYRITDRALELGSESFGSSDSLFVINNLFVECKVAINVKEASLAIIENATFYNNTVSLDVVNELDPTLVSKAVVRNSVFVGGEVQVTNHPSTVTQISQCLSDSTTLTGNNNLTADVLFSDPNRQDFTITSSEFPTGTNATSLGYQKKN